MRRQIIVMIFGSVFGLFGLLCKGEVTTVKLAIPGHSEILPFVISQERGYYREEGLDLEMILMTAQITIRAVLAGDAHFTTAINPAYSAILRSAPLKVVFGAFTRPMFVLYGKPNIRDLKDLKGKKVGIGAIGDATDLMLREIFRRHGLEVGKDITLIGAGVTATRYGALVSGALDAATLSPPTTLRAQEAGLYELVQFMKEDFAFLSGGGVLREDLLQSDRALVDKFIRGTLKGLLYARDNRSGTIPVLARIQKLREDQAAKLYDFLRPAMTTDGSIGEDWQKRSIELDLKVQGLKEAPPLPKIFDFSTTRKAYTELLEETKSPR